MEGGLQMDGGDDELEEPEDDEQEEDGDQETVAAKSTPKEGVFEYEECGPDECET
jgi:hypothetical protein